MKMINTILIVMMFLLSGCATNMSISSPIPLGGNSSVNVDSSGHAYGNVNVSGVNVNTSL
jgi:uncharacterized protein YceK